jgi:CheY-like chemotaxis protein
MIDETETDSCSRCSVILAEDNAGDVRLVREALREYGVNCELRVLSDGEEVLNFFDGLDADKDIPCPDLLLLDLSLPKYDGRQILEYLRSTERCAQTPVIVMTSSDWSGDRAIAEKNAALHYFSKPSSLDQFLHLGALVRSVISPA